MLSSFLARWVVYIYMYIRREFHAGTVSSNWKRGEVLMNVLVNGLILQRPEAGSDLDILSW